MRQAIRSSATIGLTVLGATLAFAASPTDPDDGESEPDLNRATRVAGFDNSVRIGAFKTDNLLRLPDELGVEETVGTVDLSFDLFHESRTTRASLTGLAGFRRYYEDTFDDEVLGDLYGNFNFDLFSNNVIWTIDDYFGTLQRNPYLADTPGNRENVNNFSTGPDFTVILGSSFALEMSGRYHWNNFEVTDIDNQVISVSAALTRALSSTRSISLNVNGDRIRYDDFVQYAEYDRYSGFLRFESETSRGSLVVDLGTNEISYGEASSDESADGFYGNLDFIHNFTSRTGMTLSLEQRYSDAGNIFIGFRDPGQDLNFPTYGPNVTGDPFTGRRAELLFRHDRGQLDWSIGFGLDDLDYFEEDSLDRRGIGVRLGFRWHLTSGWGVRTAARIQHGSFTSADRDDDDIFAEVALSRKITRHIDVELGYFFAQRESSDLLAEFRENRVALTLGYTGSGD